MNATLEYLAGSVLSPRERPFLAFERRRTEMTRWDECFNSLSALRGLGDNWDDEGALRPAPANIDRAVQFVEMCRVFPGAPVPTVAPGVSGEVLLIWRFGKTSLHAEIVQPDRFEWMAMDAKGSAKP